MLRMFLGTVPVIVFGGPTIADFDTTMTLGTDGVLHTRPWLGNYIYAVNNDGSTKWVFDSGAAQLCAHVEGLNGTVYAATQFGSPDTLFALDSTDGSIKWKHQADNVGSFGGMLVNGIHPLAVAADGTVYLVSSVHNTEYGPGRRCNSTTIDAIDTSGVLRWTFTTAGCGRLIAVGADGTLFTRDENSLHALQPDTGTVKWSVAPDFVDSGPVVAEDGSVFLLQDFEQSGLVLSSLSNEDGGILWKVSLPNQLPNQRGGWLEVGHNDEVHVHVSENGTCNLYVFDFDGNMLRNLPCPSCLGQMIRHHRDEDVFVTVDHTQPQDSVWARAGSDGRVLWNLTFGDDLDDHCSFGQDGTVFVSESLHEDCADCYTRDRTSAIRSGELVWSVQALRQESQPLVSEDGTTYIQGRPRPMWEDNGSSLEIVAVGADGAEKWRYQPTDPAPALASVVV